MRLARVLGTVTSTLKHPAYAASKILVVQPLDLQLQPRGASSLAVDSVGAGPGQVVLLAEEGRAAAQILGFGGIQPLRSIIIGIVDQLDFAGGRRVLPENPFRSPGAGRDGDPPANNSPAEPRVSPSAPAPSAPSTRRPGPQPAHGKRA